MKVTWSGWWYSLDKETQDFALEVAPSVLWCPRCKMLVVAFYMGHHENCCQHCGMVCEDSGQVAGPTVWPDGGLDR